MCVGKIFSRGGQNWQNVVKPSRKQENKLIAKNFIGKCYISKSRGGWRPHSAPLLTPMVEKLLPAMLNGWFLCSDFSLDQAEVRQPSPNAQARPLHGIRRLSCCCESEGICCKNWRSIPVNVLIGKYCASL